MVKEVVRLRRRLELTPGRGLSLEPEMREIQEMVFEEPCRGLILAAPHFRAAPLRALAPLFDEQVERLVERLESGGKYPNGARRVVFRALSELVREACWELGLEPTDQTTAIGFGKYRRGRVFRFVE